jgi:hypothetical protein
MPIRVELSDGRSFEVDTDDPQLAKLAGRRFLAKERGDMRPELPITPQPQTDLPGMPPAGPVGGPDVLSTATATAPPVAAFPEPPAAGLPPPKPAPSLAQLITQGVGRGVGDTVNLPYDLVTMVPNAAMAVVDTPANIANKFGADWNPPTGGFRFPMPSQRSANDVASVAENYFGIPIADTDPENLSLADNTTYNMARGGVAAGLTGLALRRWGLNRLPSAFPRYFDDLLKAYQTGGMKTVAGDVGGGMLAGAGLSATQQVPPEIRQSGGGITGYLLDIIAQLAGGVAGSQAVSTAVNGPRAAVERFQQNRPARDIPLDQTPGAGFKATSNRVADATAEWLQGMTRTPQQDAANITRNARASSALGPNADGTVPMPSSFLMSENPALEGLDKTLRQRNPAPFIESDQAVRQGAREQIASTQEPGVNTRMFPDTATDIGERAVETARQQTQSAQDAVTTANLRAQQEGADVRNAAGDAQRRAALAVDESYTNRGYIPRRAEKNELFDTAPGRNEIVPADDIVQTARTIRDQANQLAPGILPGEFLQRLERLAVDEGADAAAPPPAPGTAGSGSVRIGDLAEMRKYLATAAEKARASGNFDLVDNINTLRSQINRTIESSPGYAAANQNYREDFAPTYRPGPGDAAAKFTRDVDRDPTRTRTPPTETPSRFLTGKAEDAQALRRGLRREDLQASEEIGAPVPGAGTRAAMDWMEGDLARSGAVGRDGRLSEAGLQKWRRDNADTLTAFPEMNRRIDQLIERAQRGDMEVGMAQRTLRDRETAQRQTARDVSTGHLGLASNKDPDHAVSSVLKSNDALRNMSRLRRDMIGRDVERAQAELDAATEAREDVLRTSTLAQPRRGADYRQANQEVLDAQARLDAARNGRGDAARSMKGATAEWLYKEVTSAGDETPKLATLQKLMRDKETALAEVFSPEEMNALRNGQKLLEFLSKRSQGATVGSPTAENLHRSEALMEAGLKLWYGGLKGGNRWRNFKLLAKNFGNPGASQVDQMWDLALRAATDPDIAVRVLQRPLKPATAPAYNAPAAKTLRRVQGVRGVYDEDDSDEQ